MRAAGRTTLHVYCVDDDDAFLLYGEGTSREEFDDGFLKACGHYERSVFETVGDPIAEMIGEESNGKKKEE